MTREDLMPDLNAPEARVPDAIAVNVPGGRSLTYAELARLSDRLRDHFVRLGVGRGDPGRRRGRGRAHRGAPPRGGAAARAGGAAAGAAVAVRLRPLRMMAMAEAMKYAVRAGRLAEFPMPPADIPLIPMLRDLLE